jgi:quercetin dioxygenase-like cupin family protein
MGAMGEIFQIDEHDIPWSDYGEVGDDSSRASIRFKALTFPRTDVPPVQYVDYAPGHEDPVHSHDTGEVMIIISGKLHLGETTSGPGSAVYVPKDTNYAIRAGDEGVRYFRIVVP